MNVNNSKIAFIQLARFGDIVQLINAVQGLKQSNQNLELILICRTQFYKPLKSIVDQYFDKVFDIATHEFLLEENLEGIEETIDTFLNTLNKEQIDVLINCTYSEASNYLTALIHCNHKLGPYYNQSNQLIIKDHWSRFIYSNVLETKLNPFNIVDIFKNIIGHRNKNFNTTKTFTDLKKITVAIHPHASHTRKIWPSHKWTEVIYQLCKNSNVEKVLLLGSDKDISRTHEILSSQLVDNYKSKIINHTGKISVVDTHHLFQEIDLFIGHDSMVSHIAALNKVQTLTIPLGTVRPIETAPYLNGAVVVSPKTECFPCFASQACEFPACHNDVSPQAVSIIAKNIIDHGQLDFDALSKDLSIFHSSSIDVNVVHFDVFGLMYFKRSKEYEYDSVEILRSFYKMAWYFIFNDIESNIPFPHISSTVYQKLFSTVDGLKYLYELCEFGKKYSKFILEELTLDDSNLEKINEYSKKIEEIDLMQMAVSNQYPLLSPISNYYHVSKGQLPGSTVVELSQSSFYLFQEYASVVSVMYDLIEKTLQNYKIKINNSRPKER
ncbi:MAG: glycosyltransferase family 9 protein [Halobacteriovoraceae bacterium]|nr:glycosyltransferase family 9 protein [Halobacteriovoraceae bacterium]